MIVTVTMNPAVDKTAAVDALVPHTLHRLACVVRDAGGKGINVSKTIVALGGNSIATGFLAGDTGAAIAKSLDGLPGITPDFLELAGESRTNLKLVEPDGALTEFNEEGPEIAAADRQRLAAKLAGYAAPGVLFVLAGSAGRSAPPESYRSLIAAVHAKGGKVFLDADGAQFANALAAKPDIIKPNAFELCQYFGRQQADTPALVKMGRELNRQGVGLVCISLGAQGALFVAGAQTLRAPGLRVDCRSSVGAGDAMVAAIAYGLDGGLPLPECLRLAMATSAAACTTVGTKPPERRMVEALLPQAEIVAMAIE
ncbi:MAG: 1-phosphofructokinase family hexose kinase [Gemmiger sp.]|nr:1-phosphofructokinase family hexose kinase [Gemmiger sp.]